MLDGGFNAAQPELRSRPFPKTLRHRLRTEDLLLGVDRKPEAILDHGTRTASIIGAAVRRYGPRADGVGRRHRREPVRGPHDDARRDDHRRDRIQEPRQVADLEVPHQSSTSSCRTATCPFPRLRVISMSLGQFLYNVGRAAGTSGTRPGPGSCADRDDDDDSTRSRHREVHTDERRRRTSSGSRPRASRCAPPSRTSRNPRSCSRSRRATTAARVRCVSAAPSPRTTANTSSSRRPRWIRMSWLARHWTGFQTNPLLARRGLEQRPRGRTRAAPTTPTTKPTSPRSERSSPRGSTRAPRCTRESKGTSFAAPAGRGTRGPAVGNESGAVARAGSVPDHRQRPERRLRDRRRRTTTCPACTRHPVSMPSLRCWPRSAARNALVDVNDSSSDGNRRLQMDGKHHHARRRQGAERIVLRTRRRDRHPRLPPLPRRVAPGVHR